MAGPGRASFPGSWANAAFGTGAYAPQGQQPRSSVYGGQQNYSEGQGFATGRVGTGLRPNGLGTQSYGTSYGSQGPSRSDVMGAGQQNVQLTNEILGALRGGQGFGSQQYMNSPFAQGLQQRATNPQGYSQETLNALRGQITSGYAGNIANTLTEMRNRAGATGFGESAALLDAEARARAGNAQAQSGDLAQLAYMNEQARMAQQDAATQAYLQQQGLAQQQFMGGAGLASRLQFPFFPGSSQLYGGQGGGQGGAGVSYGRPDPRDPRQNPYWRDTQYQTEWERRQATNNSPYAFNSYSF